ncbi:hypothetical protein BBJ28_00003225, partial [Nothophytophthora sp. Chile5]
ATSGTFMVTQRVTPISADASRKMSAGKAALEEHARRNGSPHAVEAAEAVGERENDDTAPLGLAVNTRNYQALLNNLARRRRTSSGASSVASGGAASPAYQRQTLALGTVYQQHALNNQTESPRGSDEMAEAVVVEEAEDEEARDRTVVGLPVDTGNYEAIVSAGRHIRSTPCHVDRFPNRATADTTTPQRVDKEETDNESDDSSKEQDDAAAAELEDDGEDDAVMGLPISTGNYVAYLAGEQSSGIQQGGHRHRGYSNLAQHGGARHREPRVSDPTLSSSRRGQGRHDSFPTAPSNDSSGPQQRPSCFDNRRASNAAFVPHAGWIFIQKGTFRSWKRYYAVLSGLEFKFSKGVGQSPKGFGMLTAVQRMEDLQYGLMLQFGDGNKLQVRYSGEAEYNQWVGAMEKAIERGQSLNTQSKTSYTLTASEQHEGYLFKQEKNKAWKRCFFVVRIDGYIECREREQGAPDRKASGYVKAVSFADCHANGLSIQLSTDTSVVCYADSYDEQMLWYGAISSAASANGTTAQPKTSVKSAYVQTALSNHAGWLSKQAGLFKGWKRLYFTLHGIELAYAKDTNSEILLCDKVHSVEEWDGHANGLLIRLKSGRLWKVHAESYESVKRWRSVISSACRHADAFNLKKYLNSRRRKKLSPVFGGWLTEVVKGTRPVRRFYVMDGTTLGVANDVDNQLERLGTVVDVGSTRDLECGMVFTLSNGKKLKVNCDSLAGSSFPEGSTWASWRDELENERNERVEFFQKLLGNETELNEAIDDDEQQHVEVATLLSHGYQANGDVLTPLELDVISVMYDQVVRKSGVMVGSLPKWFLLLDDHFVGNGLLSGLGLVLLLKPHDADNQAKRYQHHSSLQPSVAADVSAFALAIVDARAIAHELRNPVIVDENKNPRLPSERPAFISGNEWALLVQMCAADPTTRADVLYVVQQLGELAEQDETLKPVNEPRRHPSDTVANVRDYPIYGDHSLEYVPDEAATIPTWFMSSSEVQLGASIAEGSFGVVHHAKWFDADVVAKKVKKLAASFDSKQVRQEADIWFMLNHPNVVKLYGACHTDTPFFVCEYAARGTLSAFLKGANRWQVWGGLHQAALGLQFLHNCHVVHGDLKGNNILVDEHGVVKLTDFGLSSFTTFDSSELNATSQGALGAFRWKAPECLAGSGPTFASDVYSFAMCIIEVVSGKSPWGNAMPEDAVKLSVLQGNMPNRPEMFRNDEWELVLRMCCLNPSERVSIDAVVHIQKEFTYLENGGVMATVDRLGQHLAAGMHETERMLEGDRRIDFGVKLWQELEKYENETRLLVKLASTGRILYLIERYRCAVEAWLAVFRIPNTFDRISWQQELQRERDDRLAFFENFLEDDWRLADETQSEEQQLEVLTLLKYDLKTYENKFTASERDIISKAYDSVTRRFGVVVVTLPEWFTPSMESTGLDRERDSTETVANCEEECLRDAGCKSEGHTPEKPSDAFARLVSPDVVAFGLGIFEILAHVRGADVKSQEVSSQTKIPQLPAVQPDFLNKDEWDLLVGMCAADPAQRTNLDMYEIVYKLEKLSKDEKNVQTSTITASSQGPEPVVDIKLYIEQVHQWTIAEHLRELERLIDEDPDAAAVNRLVYNRLADIYEQLVVAAQFLPLELVEDFSFLLLRFYDQLEEPMWDDLSVESFSRTTAYRNNGVHYDIDRLILSTPVLQRTASIHSWKLSWKQAQMQEWLDSSSLLTEQKQLVTTSGVAERRKIDPAEWFIPVFQVEADECIAAGGFGHVYQGKWLGADVAIKQIMADQSDEENRAHFRHELDLWFPLDHPHIIKLYGACSEDQPFFVSELASKGTLVSFLKVKQRLDLWRSLYGAALGLQYLHKRGIVHADLKGNNILVCEDGTVKLSDFGLSVFANRVEPSAGSETGVLSAVRWKAPECLNGAAPTFASDVYSFGMCIIEAITGEFPWGKSISDLAVKHLVTREKLPTRPESFSDAEWEFVTLMCAFDPQKRITVDTIVDLLSNFDIESKVIVDTGDIFARTLRALQIGDKSLRNPAPVLVALSMPTRLGTT